MLHCCLTSECEISLSCCVLKFIFNINNIIVTSQCDRKFIYKFEKFNDILHHALESSVLNYIFNNTTMMLVNSNISHYLPMDLMGYALLRYNSDSSVLIIWRVIHINNLEGRRLPILLGKQFAKLTLETRRIYPTFLLTPSGFWRFPLYLGIWDMV